MRITEKLEIGAGLTTFLIIFAYFLLFIIFSLADEYRQSDDDSDVIFLSFLYVCSFMVAAGAYFHATKKSKIAFAFLIFGAVIIVTIFSYLTLLFMGAIGATVWNILLFNLLFLVPPFLSVATVILALSSRE